MVWGILTPLAWVVWSIGVGAAVVLHGFSEAVLVGGTATVVYLVGVRDGHGWGAVQGRIAERLERRLYGSAEGDGVADHD